MTSEILSSFTPTFDNTFLNQVFANCDISNQTRQDYLYRIKRFSEFVSRQGGMNRNSLLDYKRELASDSQVTVSTKNKYLIVAKVYLQQLYRLGVLKFDLASGVRSFRISHGFKTNGFTDEEISRVVSGLKEMADIRLKAVVMLKMFAGLRDIEITRLAVEHLDLEDGVLHVQGKGRDGTEPLPILMQVVDVLREYVTVSGKRSGYLFTSLSKRNYGQSLTTKTVWLIVRDFLDDLGINRNPHQFRSFFATNLVRKLPNLYDVLVYTRHRQVQTLQTYVNQINNGRTIPKFRDAFSEFVLA